MSAKNNMNDDENDENRRPAAAAQPPPPPFIQLDFKTAGGRHITVKEETIEIAKTRVTIENAPENDQHDPTKTTSALAKHDLNSTRGLISNPPGANMMFSDFQTGSGKRLSVSKEKLTILAEKFTEPQPPATTTTTAPAEIFSGFQTATGRKLTVSKESLEAEAQKLAKLGESIAIELAPPPVVKQQPVEVTKSEVRKPQVGAVGGLRDAKPFKKPQFVTKKTVEKSESTTSVLDQTTLVPLNDLFDDMPVQKPPPLLPSPASFPSMLKPNPKREQSGSSESSSSSSSTLKSPIKFSNFHFFSSASFMPEKVAYLKIASVQIVESIGDECVLVRPQAEIVSQDVRYFN